MYTTKIGFGPVRENTVRQRMKPSCQALALLAQLVNCRSHNFSEDMSSILTWSNAIFLHYTILRPNLGQHALNYSNFGDTAFLLLAKRNVYVMPD